MPSQLPGSITRSVSQFNRLDRAFQRHELRDLDPFKALNHSGLNFNGFALGRPFCGLIRLLSWVGRSRITEALGAPLKRGVGGDVLGDGIDRGGQFFQSHIFFA
jgi:hypothetical protein